MSRTPFYNLKDFIAACSNEQNVVVPRSVLDDAQRLFNICTKKQLLEAINIEDIKIGVFVNCNELEKNNYKDGMGCTIPVLVDAYYFQYSNEDGYLAFHLIPIPPNKWRLKSFHAPQKEALTQLGDCLDPKLIECLKKIGYKEYNNAN